METALQRQRRQTRERVAAHRERKRDAAEAAAQQAAADALLSQDQRDFRSRANAAAEIAIAAYDFVHHKSSRLTASNIDEALKIVEEYNLEYRPDPAVDDVFGLFQRTLLPFLLGAYRKYQESLGRVEPTQLTLEMPTVAPPPPPASTPEPPQGIPVEICDTQVPGFPSSRL